MTTSLVAQTYMPKQRGLVPVYYRWRSCRPTFPNRTQCSVAGTSQADQYQLQKIIQKTVRLPASQYTANKGPLTVYHPAIVAPEHGYYGVCWNQMSDRPVASVARAIIPTGIFTSASGRHHSSTSSRPGCQAPGGRGCDIKHNSYERYLNRLKGKGPLRRQAVSPAFGAPVPFNPAFPVFGGKTTKTNIVAGCACAPEARVA